MHQNELNKVLGNIDIYLLDQILKGRFDEGKKVLDAGCAEGRNLRYFVYNNFEVFGADINAMAIKMAQMTYKSVPSSNFVVCNLKTLPFKSGAFDIVICTAVLHFASSQQDFDEMLEELVRVLSKNGLMFIRMATTVGLVKNKNAFTYLLQKEEIDSTFSKHGLTLLEPWKSVVVEGQRSMGVFMLKKN